MQVSRIYKISEIDTDGWFYIRLGMSPETAAKRHPTQFLILADKIEKVARKLREQQAQIPLFKEP